MLAIQTLCGDAIWLDQGRLRENGPARDVVHHYMRSVQTPHVERVWQDGADAPGDANIRLRRVALRPEDRRAELVTVRTPLSLEIDYSLLKPRLQLNVCVFLYNEDGTLVFSSDTRVVDAGEGMFRSLCHIPGDLLNAGTHSVTVTVVRDEAHTLLEAGEAVVFDIEDSTYGRGSWYDRWPGAVRPMLRWETVPAGDSVLVGEGVFQESNA
jgi:hypothetical protein